MNSAWSRRSQGRCSFLMTPAAPFAAEMRRTCEVPVLPAISKPGSRMAAALGGAAGAVDDVVHAVLHHLRVRWIEAEVDRRRVGGRRSRRARIAHQPRHDRPAAVGDARRHDGQLQRRRQHVALADAGDHRLALRPGACRSVAAFQSRVGRRPPRSCGRSMPSGAPSPSRSPHRGDLVDADAPRGFVEVAVAGLRHAPRAG